jgi:hypothetical protein
MIVALRIKQLPIFGMLFFCVYKAKSRFSNDPFDYFMTKHADVGCEL